MFPYGDDDTDSYQSELSLVTFPVAAFESFYMPLSGNDDTDSYRVKLCFATFPVAVLEVVTHAVAVAFRLSGSARKGIVTYAVVKVHGRAVERARGGACGGGGNGHSCP